jgi:hypothetical protein
LKVREDIINQLPNILQNIFPTLNQGKSLYNLSDNSEPVSLVERAKREAWSEYWVQTVKNFSDFDTFAEYDETDALVEKAKWYLKHGISSMLAKINQRHRIN